MVRWSVVVWIAAVVVGLASCQQERPHRDPQSVVNGDPTASVRAAYVEARQAEGSTDARYALREEAGAFVAETLGGRGRMEIGSSGMTLRREGEPWQAAFGTTRYGCARQLEPLDDRSAPTPGSTSNRVVVASSAGGVPLVEWYEHGPLGLEHGFTLEESPCSSARELTIEERVDGLEVVPRPDGRGVDLRDASGTVRAHYTDLRATDAQGLELPSRMEAADGSIRIDVDARSAVFPVTVDPLAWFQLQKLSSADGATYGGFGEALALSGSTALVGAPGFMEATSNAGEADVFVESAGTWTEQQALVPSDAATGNVKAFGLAVALDGDTAIVSAPGQASQSVYIFVRSGTSWTQQQELALPSGALFFGLSVAVSGSTALVGAILMDAPPEGAIYVFTQSGGTWTQQQILQASDATGGDQFGTPLVLQGSTLIAGATGATVGANQSQGAAYVFTQSGSTFTEQQKLVASDGATNDNFGAAVAFDGTTALVSAPAATVGNNEGQGAVYAYTLASGTFTQQQKLVATNGAAGDRFGAAVAIAGGNAIVGVRPNTNTPPPGQVYPFVMSGGTWTQATAFGAPDGVADDGFGTAIVMEGTRALLGAPGATVGTAAELGAAYVESFLSTGATTCSAGTDCGTGFCADGVCCDAACTGQCQACDVPGVVGTCTPVSGSPHGSRPPCSSSGPACGGMCDGTDVSACSYPRQGTPCGSTCSGNQETDSTCDGNGTCVVGQPGTCRNNLGCDSTSGTCYASCTANADCATGYFCASGTCAPGALCLSDGHTSQGPNGSQDCSPYSCNSVTGACNGAPCATVDDCSAPNVCDDTEACVAPPDTSALSGGCSVGTAEGGRCPVALLALPWLALVRSRAARRGRERARRGSRP